MLFNNDSSLVMRLQDKGNRFVIVDKDTDKRKAYDQIERSSFRLLDYDPTEEHIERVTDWAGKWCLSGDISSDWKNYIINSDARPGKNVTLYKFHKPDIPVRLLTTGCNTAIEHLSMYIENICAPLANSIETRIRDTFHLLDIIDTLNSDNIPDTTMLVSFDIVNTFPSIDNLRGMKAVANALEMRKVN